MCRIVGRESQKELWRMKLGKVSDVRSEYYGDTCPSVCHQLTFDPQNIGTPDHHQSKEHQKVARKIIFSKKKEMITIIKFAI
jgi:hypothetical protein